MEDNAEQPGGAGALALLVEVAHDMRSPLGAILMLVERMQHGHSGPVTTLQRQQLGLIYGATFGLSAMASDLMELGRGGAQLLQESPKPFSIADVLRSVRVLVQPLAEEKRLTLRSSAPSVDRRVGQQAALRRVLLNLVTNAFKFTTVGSVTVLIEQQPRDDVLFVVEDTGRGIPAHELAGMDAAFANAGTVPMMTAYSSGGLGLAICHKLVSAMGGVLSVESRVDHGTRFSFQLHLPPA